MQTDQDYAGGFGKFIGRFIDRHPEWFSDVRGREWGAAEAVEAPVAKEAGHGDVGNADVGVGMGDFEVAEEVRDEEAEAEEAAVLSDGEF